MDVIMNLTQDGVRLVFDPNSQRLKIIEVMKGPSFLYNKLWQYRGTLFEFEISLIVYKSVIL